MSQPVRPIHVALTFVIFIYNVITSVAVFFKEIAYLLTNHANYEFDLHARINELHEDLERLEEDL